MQDTKKEFWVLTGPHGAGKSTFAPRFLKVFQSSGRSIRLVSPDIDAPNFDEATLRLYDELIPSLRNANVNVMLETTAPGRTSQKLVEEFRDKGYKIGVIAIGIATPEVAMANINHRVATGGHNVWPFLIGTMYTGCVMHTPKMLMMADEARIYDNTHKDFKLIATRGDDTGFVMQLPPVEIAPRSNPYMHGIISELAAAGQLAPARSNPVQQAWLANYLPN